ALAYATVLLTARWLLSRAPIAASIAAVNESAPNEARLLRRSFISALAGTGVAYAATLWLGRSAGTSSSDLPLASVNSLPASPPATPEALATPVATPADATAVVPTVGQLTAISAATPTTADVGSALSTATPVVSAPTATVATSALPTPTTAVVG